MGGVIGGWGHQRVGCEQGSGKVLSPGAGAECDRIGLK